jgi:hypothetical protein
MTSNKGCWFRIFFPQWHIFLQVPDHSHLTKPSLLRRVEDTYWWTNLKVEYHRYLSRQLMIAFDLYILIHSSVDTLVAEALKRNSPQTPQKILAQPGGTTWTTRRQRGHGGIWQDRNLHSSVPPWLQPLNCWYGAEWGVVHPEFRLVRLCESLTFTLLRCRATYPLAIVAKVIDIVGDGLGGGYDIGCQFRTTLDNSPLGPHASSLHYISLVGAFHPAQPSHKIHSRLGTRGLRDVQMHFLEV